MYSSIILPLSQVTKCAPLFLLSPIPHSELDLSKSVDVFVLWRLAGRGDGAAEGALLRPEVAVDPNDAQ